MKRGKKILETKLKLLKIQGEVIKKNSVSMLTRQGGEKIRGWRRKVKRCSVLGNRI